MKRNWIFSGALSVLLLAGSAFAESQVAMFRAGPQLDGVYPSPSPARLDGLLFAFDAHSPIRSSPAVADGAIYFGDAAGDFYALDAHTGAKRWQRNVGSGVTSAPAYIGGKVYFTTRGRELLALDAKTGKSAWRLDLGADLGPQNYWEFYTSSPTVFGGNLYVGTGSGDVLCVSPANGRVLWRKALGSRVRTAPAVTDTYVVVGTMDGHIVAFDRKTGTQAWSFATEGASHTYATKNNDTTSVFASPSISGDTVVAGGRDGFLYAVDLKTGQQKWKITHDGGSWILSSAIEGDSVYSGSGSAYFVQRGNLANGSEQWHFKTASALFGSVSIAGDVVVINDLTGALQAVNKADGTLLWSFFLGDKAFSTPVIADGVVYASSDAGVLYALQTSPVAATVDQGPRRIVYVKAPRSDTAFSWFLNGVDGATLAYFKLAGYEQVDDAGLEKAMDDEINGGRHSVIVLANDALPDAVIDATTGSTKLKTFLMAGGTVVATGPNPVTMKTDPVTGELTDINSTQLQAVLGITPLPRNIDLGYHVSSPTEDGARWGLEGEFVTNGALDPAQADVVLAKDEFGMATQWVKYFGPKHGEMIQLDLPRGRATDLAPYRAVIEHGLLVQNSEAAH